MRDCGKRTGADEMQQVVSHAFYFKFDQLIFLIYIPFLPQCQITVSAHIGSCPLLPLSAFRLWWMCFLFNNHLLPFSGPVGISVCELQNGYARVILKGKKHVLYIGQHAHPALLSPTLKSTFAGLLQKATQDIVHI